MLLLLTSALLINVSDVSAANSTFNTTSISNSADTVKNYVETNQTIPNEVNVANQKVNSAQYLYLLTSSVQNINKGSTSPVTLKSVSNPSSTSENVTSGTITKTEYLSLASQITTFINTNGRLPNYVTTSLGSMSYKNLIYTYSKIMSFYKTYNRLPNTVSIKPFPTSTEGNTNSNSSGTTNNETNTSGTTNNETKTVTFTTSQIITAASSVKTFKETNNRLPEYVTISTTQVTMAQFLQLLTYGVIQINNGSTASLTLKVVNSSGSQSESITTGTIYKSEFLTLAQQIKNTIDTTGKAPASISTTLGTMNFENLVYTYAKIMAFYGTNKRLPNSVSVNAFTTNTTNSSSVQAILDSIGKTEAQFEDIQGQSSGSVMERVGYGDCWADSQWLYNKLNAAGIPARIMGYVGGGTGVWYEHAWVQYNIGNGWVNWNYVKYGSQHYGDGLGAASYVLIAASSKTVDVADMSATGY